MNEEKFSGKAEVFAKFRTTYSEGFIEYLYSKVGFNASSIMPILEQERVFSVNN